MTCLISLVLTQKHSKHTIYNTKKTHNLFVNINFPKKEFSTKQLISLIQSVYSKWVFKMCWSKKQLYASYVTISSTCSLCWKSLSACVSPPCHLFTLLFCSSHSGKIPTTKNQNTLQHLIPFFNIIYISNSQWFLAIFPSFDTLFNKANLEKNPKNDIPF